MYNTIVCTVLDYFLNEEYSMKAVIIKTEERQETIERMNIYVYIYMQLV